MLPSEGRMPIVNTASSGIIERLYGLRGRCAHIPTTTFARYAFTGGAAMHHHYFDI